MNENSVNQQIAEQICQDFQRHGRTFAMGQWVALLDGDVLAVAESLDQALDELRAVEPDPGRGMLFEVRSPVVDVVR